MLPFTFLNQIYPARAGFEPPDTMTLGGKMDRKSFLSSGSFFLQNCVHNNDWMTDNQSHITAACLSLKGKVNLHVRITLMDYTKLTFQHAEQRQRLVSETSIINVVLAKFVVMKK